MIRRLALVSLLAVLCGTGARPARAEIAIAGWAVSSKPDEDGDCSATKQYTDERDGGSGKAVVLFVVGKTDRLAGIVISMGYSGWQSPKGTLKADLSVDGAAVVKDVTWQINETTAAANLPEVDAVAAALGTGKVLELTVGGKPASFDITGGARALGATQYCQQRG